MKRLLICFLFIFLLFSLNRSLALTIPQTSSSPNVVIGSPEQCSLGFVVSGVDFIKKELVCVEQLEGNITMNNSEPLWNGNYSTFLTHITWNQAMNGTLATLQNVLNFGFYNSTSNIGNWSLDKPNYYNYSDINDLLALKYNISNPFGFYNSTTLIELDPFWTGNSTSVLAHLIDTGNPHSVTASQTNAVALTGDESIAGVKTFTSFPITPSAYPSADYQVANKKYVDMFTSGITFQPAVESKTTPVFTCNMTFVNERYIVPVGAIGDWLGKDNNVTTCNGTIWLFEVPIKGWALITLDTSEGWVWNEIDWALFSNPTAYTASDGVQLIGNNFQSDLLNNGGLYLDGEELAVNFTGYLTITQLDNATIIRTNNGSWITTNVGNWSAEKSGYLNATTLDNATIVRTWNGTWVVTNVGNWTSDKINYINTTTLNNATIIRTTNASWIVSNVGNYSNENSTIARAGSINCGSSSEFVQAVTTNSSGVFVICRIPDGSSTPTGSNMTSKHIYLLSTPQTAQAWTNMPLATTELFGNTYARQKAELNYTDRFRIVQSVSVAGFPSSVFRLQYSPDQLTWYDCNTTNTTIGVGIGLKVGNWLTPATNCKGDVYLRIVGQGGNGVVDPAWRELYIEVRQSTVVLEVGGGGNPFNQVLNTTSEVIFNHLYLNSSIAQVMNITGSGGAEFDIIVTDEELPTGYSAPTGSIGTSGQATWTKFGSGDSDWGQLIYSIFDSGTSNYDPVVKGSVVGTAAGIKFFDAANANWTRLKANDTLTSNITYTLPATAPRLTSKYMTASPSGIMTWEGPPVPAETDPIYTAENSTIARTGSGTCVTGDFANAATTSTTGITLTCSTETDPHWTNNQSNYFNKTDINSTYVPYTGATKNVDLGNWGIENKNDTTGKLVFKALTGGITPPTSSFVIAQSQLGTIDYILPPSLPIVGTAYLEVNPITGALKWSNPSVPAETDPIYTAQNTTIVRAGSYTCSAGQYASATIVNSSGVFMTCSAVPTDIPTGMLAPFYLTACPSGWTLADGTASTPNLTGRFVIGNSSTYAVNTSGGSTSYTPTGSITIGSGTTVNIVTPSAKLTFNGNAATIIPPYYSTIWCMKT